MLPLQVLDLDTLQVVSEHQDSRQGISDLKFSPDGQLLAAATFDQTIEVYSVKQGTKYGRLARCSGEREARPGAAVGCSAVWQQLLKHACIAWVP